MGWKQDKAEAGLDYLKPASARSYVCLVVDLGRMPRAHVARLEALAAADAHLCLLGVSEPESLRAAWQGGALRRVAERSKAKHAVEAALARLPPRCRLLILGLEGERVPIWLGGVMGHAVQPLLLPVDTTPEGLPALVEPGIGHCLREALTSDPEFAYLRP
ncbi:hypothetical protein IAI18_08290 [Acetobacteraceae bacterium H6797]|nr:hypothetical protein [Acetobacteraceae bacterium H6797]